MSMARLDAEVQRIRQSRSNSVMSDPAEVEPVGLSTCALSPY